MAVVTNDGQRIVDALERQNMIHEDTDITKLTVDIEQIVGAYWNLPLKEIPFRIVIHKVFDVFRIHHVHPPSAFVLTLKSLMTIENFARSMDPEFNIVEALRPYARRSAMRNVEPKHVLHQVRKVMEDAGDLASRIPKDLNAILARARQGKFQIRVQHEHLEALTRTLDKSSNRISFALIITGLLVGSSMLVAQESLREVGFVGYIIAAIFGLWLLISIMRGGRL
jgi:ubiquinone biosynthesis protein